VLKHKALMKAKEFAALATDPKNQPPALPKSKFCCDEPPALASLPARRPSRKKSSTEKALDTDNSPAVLSEKDSEKQPGIEEPLISPANVRTLSDQDQLGYFRALEKTFWRSVTYAPLMYGADVPGSLFPLSALTERFPQVAETVKFWKSAQEDICRCKKKRKRPSNIPARIARTSESHLVPPDPFLDANSPGDETAMLTDAAELVPVQAVDFSMEISPSSEQQAIAPVEISAPGVWSDSGAPESSPLKDTLPYPVPSPPMDPSIADKVSHWNTNRLGSLLDEIQLRLAGVNTPYLYLGSWKSSFGKFP
jgi:hypothetical protein